MSEDVLIKLSLLMPTLPKAEKKVANYLIEHSTSISDMTLSMLSDETHTSEATIIRLCKELGFTGYLKLRQSFVATTLDSRQADYNTIKADDGINTIFDKVVNDIRISLNNTGLLISEEYQKALDVLQKAEKVFLFCTGDSTVVCEYACLKFRRIGIPSFFASDVMQQYELAMGAKTGDVAIFISNSGRSSNVVISAKLAKQRDCTNIAITQAFRSPLMKNIDIPIFMSANDSTQGRDSITRRIAAMVIIETLYQGLLVSGDHYDMLDNVMNSFEINSELQKNSIRSIKEKSVD